MSNEIWNLARNQAFLVHRPAAWLRVTGEDALTFLQGQITNDLRNLETEPAVYGLWLNHKGRALGDGFVGRAAGGGYWIGSYFTEGAALKAHLEAFIVADDVTIADATAEMGGATLFGEGARAAVPPAGVVVFSGRRGVEPAVEWGFAAEWEPAVRAALAGWREASAEEVERWRIAARVPAVPRDIGPSDLPNEGELETVAISYTKGCYLGQEVMARLKNLGQVRRKLVRVRGAGAAPTVPAALQQEERKVGELRSAVADGEGFAGLALVTLLNVRGAAPWRLAPEAGGGEVEPIDWPTA